MLLDQTVALLADTISRKRMTMESLNPEHISYRILEISVEELEKLWYDLTLAQREVHQMIRN